MVILDIILLICFVPAIVRGLSKGFVTQILELAALILGVWAAFNFSNMLSSWLSAYIVVDQTVLNVISFVIILILVSFVLHLIGSFITKILKTIALGWLNSVLGLAFAIIQTGLVLGLLILLFESLNSSFQFIKPEMTENAVVYNYLRTLANEVFPYLKGLIANVNV